jgi:hypothetical protein
MSYRIILECDVGSSELCETKNCNSPEIEWGNVIDISPISKLYHIALNNKWECKDGRWACPQCKDKL